MYFRSEGVVISKRNFGEADRIVAIYTRDFGKVTALAKGVRRPKSRKAGHLELGNWCKVFIARGKSLDLLTEIELKKAFGIADFTEEKANKIYHFLEIVDKLTVEHHKNQPVFNLLIQFLKSIEKKDDFSLAASVFKIKLLSNMGFFSAVSLKDSKTKEFLKLLEQNDFEVIKTKIKLSPNGCLKLLEFLDSMIERLTERKLTTTKFLYG